MKKYSIPQLEALLAISRLGTFNAAAKQISVTQPTISLRIKELEEVLGESLFEREGRLAKLSSEGVIVVQYAEQVLGLLDEMEARLKTSDPLQGTLRVGACETVAISGLPRALGEFSGRYPGVNVQLTVGNSFVMADALNSNRLDIAFLVSEMQQTQFHVERLATAAVAWVGAAHQLMDTTPIRPAHLFGKTVLCVPPPSPLYDLLIEWCSTEKSRRPSVSTCNSLAMIAKLVNSGLAMSVLPTCILRDEIYRGSVVSYPQEAPFAPLNIYAAYRRSTQSDGIMALVNIARRVLQESTYVGA